MKTIGYMDSGALFKLLGACKCCVTYSAHGSHSSLTCTERISRSYCSRCRVMCLRIGCSIKSSLGSNMMEVCYLPLLHALASPCTQQNHSQRRRSVNPSTTNYANDIPILHCQSMMTVERHSASGTPCEPLHTRNLVTDQQVVPWMSACQDSEGCT